MCTKGPRQRGEFRSVFEAIEEALWNSRKSYLGADEGSGENTASLILSAAVESVEHRLFEVIVKTCRQIIGDRKLVINRTGHPINNRDFPRGLDFDSRIESCVSHVRRGEESVGGREPSSPGRLPSLFGRRPLATGHRMKGKSAIVHQVHQFVR